MLTNYSVWWLIRKETSKQKIICQVNEKDETVRIGMLVFVWLIVLLGVFSKTNDSTLNAKSKKI